MIACWDFSSCLAPNWSRSTINRGAAASSQGRNDVFPTLSARCKSGRDEFQATSGRGNSGLEVSFGARRSSQRAQAISRTIFASSQGHSEILSPTCESSPRASPHIPTIGDGSPAKKRRQRRAVGLVIVDFQAASIPAAHSSEEGNAPAEPLFITGDTTPDRNSINGIGHGIITSPSNR